MKHKPNLTDVMTREPETIHLGQPLSDAYALLQNREYHHVPVVDGDAPVGMISSTATRLLAASVLPVETTSTMASARPTSGANSIEP